MNNDDKASQPKVESIGDDAQFKLLLAEYIREARYAKTLRAAADANATLVTYIHEFFRAPADQAASVASNEWREVLGELADLVDDAYEGNYTIDSFTTQPARILLEKIPQQPVAAQSADKPATIDEPDMLWLHDDGEVFANGPDEFASDYASNSMLNGDEAEVLVDCAYRAKRRTMRIRVLDKGDDQSRSVEWEWVAVSASAADESEKS